MVIKVTPFLKKLANLSMVLSLLLLVACDTVKAAIGLKPSKVWLEKITFQSEDNMNDNSPVKVHVVVAYTEDLSAKLGAMNATTYFQQAQKLKTDAGEDLDVFSVDVVPGATEELAITPRSSQGVIALMFARYSTPGDHRVNVSADYELRVHLNKTDFKVDVVKKG